jgi:hypothetical protein
MAIRASVFLGSTLKIGVSVWGRYAKSIEFNSIISVIRTTVYLRTIGFDSIAVNFRIVFPDRPA